MDSVSVWEDENVLERMVVTAARSVSVLNAAVVSI